MLLPVYDKLLPKAVCSQLSRAEIESSLQKLMSIYAASWQIYITKGQGSDDTFKLPHLEDAGLCKTHRSMNNMFDLLNEADHTVPTKEFEPYSELLHTLLVQFYDVTINEDVTKNFPNLRLIKNTSGKDTSYKKWVGLGSFSEVGGNYWPCGRVL